MREGRSPVFLVAGRNRLRAAELAGLKEIPAMFFKGDRRHARLITIEENLFRKDLAALERAEQYAKWFKIAEHSEVSGQDVRKPKAGRPEGGLAKVARELPIAGKTVEARRAGLLCRPNNWECRAGPLTDLIWTSNFISALFITADSTGPTAGCMRPRFYACCRP